MYLRRVISLSVVILASVVVGLELYWAHLENKNALFDAAEHGDLEKVKTLVQGNVLINQKNESDFGFTPLIVAIFHDNTNVAYYLIEFGADVNVPSSNGETPLMWAAGGGDDAAPLLEYLISHRANLDLKDKDGFTIFDYARSDPPKPKLIEILESARRGLMTKPNGNVVITNSP
jgi:ankyrin repeat protein